MVGDDKLGRRPDLTATARPQGSSGVGKRRDMVSSTRGCKWCRRLAPGGPLAGESRRRPERTPTPAAALHRAAGDPVAQLRTRAAAC
jgi:hypothetical protein